MFLMFCLLVSWHMYLASTQRMKWIPTHWPDPTFCDNEQNHLLDFYKNSLLSSKGQFISGCLYCTASKRKERLWDGKKSNTCHSGWRELWSIHRRVSECKERKKNISQKLPEGSNSFTGNLLSYFNIQCYEDIHTHIRSWAKANQNQIISQKIVCQVTL